MKGRDWDVPNITPAGKKFPIRQGNACRKTLCKTDEYSLLYKTQRWLKQEAPSSTRSVGRGMFTLKDNSGIVIYMFYVRKEKDMNKKAVIGIIIAALVAAATAIVVAIKRYDDDEWDDRDYFDSLD